MTRKNSAWDRLLGLGFQAADWRPVRDLLAEYMKPQQPYAAVERGRRWLQAEESVLAVATHPDDLEFLAAGTLLRHLDHGNPVHVLVLSDGEKGGRYELDQPLASVRKQEMREAARVLGYRSLSFAGLPDGNLQRWPKLSAVLERASQEVDASSILVPDPRGPFPWFMNRDHRATGQAALQLVQQGPWQERKVYLYATRHPTVVVGIDDELEKKLEGLWCHQTQMRFGSRHQYRQLLQALGAMYAAALPTGDGFRYAEGFYQLR